MSDCCPLECNVGTMVAASACHAMQPAFGPRADARRVRGRIRLRTTTRRSTTRRSRMWITSTTSPAGGRLEVRVEKGKMRARGKGSAGGAGGCEGGSDGA
eukprot:3106977-Rhodomonas_salina.2